LNLRRRVVLVEHTRRSHMSRKTDGV